MQIDDKLFRDAMSSFPSGVTIVTTVDDEGRSWGFTASAFSSLSCDPPMILVCPSNKAECFGAFTAATRFAVNILAPEHEKLAIRFATKGGDKFANGDFVLGQSGMPILPHALVALECRLEGFYPGGDHSILTGIIEHANLHDGEAAVYFRGKFRSLASPKRTRKLK